MARFATHFIHELARRPTKAAWRVAGISALMICASLNVCSVAWRHWRDFPALPDWARFLVVAAVVLLLGAHAWLMALYVKTRVRRFKQEPEFVERSEMREAEWRARSEAREIARETAGADGARRKGPPRL